ncbi:heavy metal translocating P-type ATPase [Umezawaea endophytica]|uniref:Heavy metal translocating P-type ATPase n=1 Tax=Umezawaea endophytica TaxID=1654476 RepID=A0A9X2VXU5_9PSEU|nr:heavy metal translocating P-type ATPase [Umezawaea endophytica]MCS7483698.1 heavy metal translocating P-type ATPase [Umezawaea endophytica]
MTGDEEFGATSSTDRVDSFECARSRASRRYAGEFALFAVTGALLAAGIALWAVGAPRADVPWAAATVIAVLPAVVWVVADLRAGRFGADVLAVLALVGTVVVGEPFAGAVVAVMLGGGRALDAYAQRRAGRDLRALLDRAPRTARLRTGTGLRVVPVEQVRPGQHLVLGQGEVAPVDAVLLGTATLDESALTGEAAPVDRVAGERVRSGVVNAGASVDLRAVATERDSTYAGVVDLAREAAATSAPAVRLADRVAAVFLPVALVVAGVAAFLADDLTVAVAVLVTATPCPLLLAVPVAVTAGMSRASRVGVVVRDGRALEVLGTVRTAVLDKTGTVTVGRPTVTAVSTAPGWSREDVLGLAAAVEQVSSHVFAACVVAAASAAGRRPGPATDVVERSGRATSGVVDGCGVTVGALDTKRQRPDDWIRDAEAGARSDGASTVWVSRDGEPVGVLLVRDTIRSDAARTLERLRAAGLSRLVLLTGDKAAVARQVADGLGFDEVVADCDPADKVAKVRSEKATRITAMVGDGFNDAPALATADVGVALGSKGSSAAVRAADVVLLDDRIDGLADAVEIAGRAHRIARQSALAGMGLSLVAMGFAAAGLLAPAPGAVLQEAIDIAVIFNALRVLLPTRPGPPTPAAPRSDAHLEPLKR